MTDERDAVITFEVRRGSFSIPSHLKVDDPEAWAYRFASSMPEDSRAQVSSYRNGDVEVYHWRVITTRVREL